MATTILKGDQLKTISKDSVECREFSVTLGSGGGVFRLWSGQVVQAGCANRDQEAYARRSAASEFWSSMLDIIKLCRSIESFGHYWIIRPNPARLFAFSCLLYKA